MTESQKLVPVDSTKLSDEDATIIGEKRRNAAISNNTLHVESQASHDAGNQKQPSQSRPNSDLKGIIKANEAAPRIRVRSNRNPYMTVKLAANKNPARSPFSNPKIAEPIETKQQNLGARVSRNRLNNRTVKQFNSNVFKEQNNEFANKSIRLSEFFQ